MLKTIAAIISGFFASLTHSASLPASSQHVQQSPYYTLDYYDEESNILCRVFITLGYERLPEAYRQDYKKTAKNLFENGELVYAVAETYFYNRSSKQVVITPQSFTWKGGLSGNPVLIEDFTITVEPNSQAITPPTVDYAFYLINEFTIEFELLIDNKKHIIKGQAKRITPGDINKNNEDTARS